MLLSLITRRKLDVTELALAEVTDEFLAYVATLDTTAELEEISQFLLVASTLVEIKAARLLPGVEKTEEFELAVLEARDMLFARLLQYRAYSTVSEEFDSLIRSSQKAVARTAGPELHYKHVTPPLAMTISPSTLRDIYLQVLYREPQKTPEVSTAHVHAPEVDMEQQRRIILTCLEEGEYMVFSELTSESTIAERVARFLVLLDLCKERLCLLKQAEPLGHLYIYARQGGDTP